ncbi:galactose-1-phosphate uridylyltransferase [Buchananella hordeovulneris]|uniref:galactose-1-phosphate uridylyltransferase n=1 Tax=Buchananella hordeovulneris TaxID=52770 RepID=UPI000F5FE041|nr:galactose-1-phosphate uridylyltransferase [Buchananella hordeovulneris]RRD43582.1 galactose-1-phosphate uridylyltransferase [Buchananella hordeovulneris]RRD52839.1 galactose-1-phosphate uridylyltransferase [Buchananella hordeovulneris]
MSQQASVRRTATKLADGREFFYFDDSPEYVSGEKTRRLDDPRPLPDRFVDAHGQPVQAPQMRRDPLTGEWVPMATHRMNRTFLPPADANPLAPARPGADYSDGEIPDTDYDVVVFENRFPSLLATPTTPLGGQPTPLEGEELFLAAPAAGRCEVICFSPRLEENLASVGVKRMRTVIEAWADRTRDLSQLPGIAQVFCFENHGADIGVTLHHPHGQIYAYPYITPRTQAMLRQATPYRQRTGRNLLTEVLAAELRSGRRIIAQTDHWVLYVPVAARWPVEMHLAPRREVADLAELTDAEKADLAPLYLRMLQAANRFHLDADGNGIELNYLAGWHQAPVGQGREDLRLHLQFFSFLRSPGKLKYLAGSESQMGAWISDTSPEKIADRLREVFLDEVE